MIEERLFFDVDGNRTEPEKAVRAEVITRTEDGSVVKVDYYTASPLPSTQPSKP